MAKTNAGVSLQAMQAEMAAKLAEFEARVRDAEKRAAEAEAEAKAAKAAPQAGISFTDKGQIMLTFAAGKGTMTARYYSWHWETILKHEKEIRAAFKDKRAMTEAAFRASM